MGKVFLSYGTPITAVSLFRYLGCTFLSSDNDWRAVEWKLRKARGKWGRLEKILGREGADKITAGRFYVALVQAMLLFGSKTLVLTPQLEKSLKGFCYWAERQMAGMGPKLQQDGKLVYPPIGVALSIVVL